MRDPYSVLGVNRNATEEEIKKAYKKLALKHHPDRGGDEEKFKEVAAAYSKIIDKKQGKVNPGGHGFNFGGFNFGGFDFSDFVDLNDFVFSFTKDNYRDFNERLDITVNVMVTLKDVYKGDPITVKYNRYSHCSDCDGTGFDKNGISDDCEICEGKNKNCEYCDNGKIYTQTCKKCKGEKVILSETKFKLNNISNIRKSHEKFLKNYGHQSRYYKQKKGTLKLNIIYQNVKGHEIIDGNLFYNLNLHFQDAIDGIKYKYETLDDKKLMINIPKKTQDKDIVRIKEKGLLSNQGRGDLYFKINIIIDYDRL